MLCDTATVHSRLGCPEVAIRREGGHADGGVWHIDTPAGRAHLHDPLTLVAPGRWDIAGETAGVLPWLVKILTGTTAHFPAAVPEWFSEHNRETYTAAYRDYLCLRYSATKDALNDLDRAASAYGTHRHLPYVLNSAANDVSRIIFRHQWRHADTETRRAWAAMGKPPADPAQSNLQQWLRRGRWLFAGSSDMPAPGQPDNLADDLRKAAEIAADTAAELLGDDLPGGPSPLRDFQQEHEQTLRALADTTVPGLDALTEPSP